MPPPLPWPFANCPYTDLNPVLAAGPLWARALLLESSARRWLGGQPPPFRWCSGPEFVAKALQGWIGAVGATTAYIAPDSPWENGYIRSFNVRLRNELPGGEIFYSPAEARIVIENWWRCCNTLRPHGSLGYKPPAPEVFVPAHAARSAALSRPAPPTALVPRPAMH